MEISGVMFIWVVGNLLGYVCHLEKHRAQGARAIFGKESTVIPHIVSRFTVCVM